MKNFISQLPLGRDVVTISSDNNGLVALSKPAGLLSHPNSAKESTRSLLTCPYKLGEEVYEWTDDQGTPRRLWLLNRLDSATSGVILVSANEELAQVMRLHFRQKRVRKIYSALVFGQARPATQHWRDRLAVQKRGGQIRTSTQGNIPAECKMSVVGTEGHLSLLRLEPITGRSHQLRVQCAKRHFPIVGDATYGDFSRNREYARATGCKRMFLHSLETSFAYEFKGKSFQFKATAPLPPEFPMGS